MPDQSSSRRKRLRSARGELAPWLIEKNVPVTEFEIALCTYSDDAAPALAVEAGNGVSCDGEAPITPLRSVPGIMSDDEPVASPVDEDDELAPQDFVAAPEIPADLV